MSGPLNEFERTAEASRLVEVERNRTSPTSRLQGTFFALLGGTAGAVMLRLGRFADGHTGGPWALLLFSSLCGATTYIAVRWGREAGKHSHRG